MSGQTRGSSNKGNGHVSRHPQFDLPPFPHGCHRWYGHDPGEAAMTEFIAALLAFLSIGVFVAHALDAYRTG